MTLNQLELEVSSMSRNQFLRFAKWFANFAESKWNDEFEQDVKSGKLDALGKQALNNLKLGKVTAL